MFSNFENIQKLHILSTKENLLLRLNNKSRFIPLYLHFFLSVQLSMEHFVPKAFAKSLPSFFEEDTVSLYTSRSSKKKKIDQQTAFYKYSVCVKYLMNFLNNISGGNYIPKQYLR